MTHINNNNNSKVVVVIGAGRGIGKAIAKEFAKNGYCVMINDFEKEEKLKNTAEEISKIIADNNHNSKVAYIIGDVSQEQTCINLMEQTINIFGRIDVLINNASIAEKTAVGETNRTSRSSSSSSSSSPTNLDTSQYKQTSSYFTLEEYEIADTSLKGLYLCIREAAKRMIIQSIKEEEEEVMKERKMGRRNNIPAYSIINISSSYDSIPKSEADAYTFSMSGVDPFTSSRAEVKALTKTVAFQLAQNGIRVNAIAPGLIATESNIELLQNEKKRTEEEMEVPFHRIGQPEEIARIALFLASEDASYITGSLIYADGGLSLSRSNYFLESKIEQD
ncbi:MAG TPA: SDR family oxidoreductase [Nitrososphaeraceae archaeon]|nr:SDR family oxidoreductase [Nitrososphaeraceae archaeon]